MRRKNKELFFEQCKKHYEALLSKFNLSWFSGNIILSETYIGNLLFQLSENQLQERATENCQISQRAHQKLPPCIFIRSLPLRRVKKLNPVSPLSISK